MLLDKTFSIMSFLMKVIFISVFLIKTISTSEYDALSNALCRSCFNKVNENFCIIQNCNCNHSEQLILDVKDEYTILDAPIIHCKEENLISVSWKTTNDFVYFLEISDDGGEKYFNFTEVTRCGLYVFHELKENINYNIRLWGVSSHNKYGKSDYIIVRTSKKIKTVLPVTSVNLKKIKLVDNKYEASIIWTPTADMSCYYDIVYFGEDMGDYKQIEIKDPTHPHQVNIEGLEFGKNYSVSIMAVNNHHESPKKWIFIQTPTCLETYLTLVKCPPELPQMLSVKEVLVDNHNISLFDVTFNWTKPKFTPVYYTAHLINLQKYSNDSVVEIFLNISGDANAGSFEKVELGIHYQLILTAWSIAGPSPAAVQYRHVNISQVKMVSKSWNYIEIIVIIVCPLTIVTIIISIIFINRLLDKKVRIEQRCRYFKNLDRVVPEIINSESEVKTPEDLDEWELNIGKLNMQSILGQGAFGIVRRGCYKVSREQTIEVAIKMLKEMPSQEELRQFYHEIEIMKTVSPHPHLVSMVGCITRGGPEGPLLVVKYCAKRDLQTFLRTAWDRLTNQSTSIDYIDMTGSLYETPHEFSNKMYDFASQVQGNELFIYPKDLISFARQVIQGMIHLSNLRVIHRDLAARNVLLCEDNTVKISDFGLSRDVYRDNVYCKQGNGKLPIRWMALESMTHQRYTTQSDVWSFGVLLWEIVTLGSSPYPSVLNRDLLRLLESGYRMSRPVNCSNELYSIMLNCWKAIPKERPTFSELQTSFDNLLEGVSNYLNLDLSPSKDLCQNVSNIEIIHPERYVRIADP